MSAVPEPVSNRLRLARDLANAGYLVFPLLANTKEPATPHGFKDASSDVEQIDVWWERNPDFNIGLACGLQDNGLYVAVIDVDAKHGGVLAWKQLMRDHGGGWQRYMPIHKTPRQGFHIFGAVDPALMLNASNGFPRGIDTRGAGGYVVLPDSVFIDTETGEIGSYVCTPNNLWSTEPGAFPEYVLARWQTGPQRLPTGAHPSTREPDADSPLAWMKANINWVKELGDDGFALQADFGGEMRWTRPGKTRGVSLSLHLGGNGCVVVWSENCPEWMVDRRCGQPTSDGHWSMNGFQYICARDYGGDVKAAMAGIRRGFMPAPPIASAERPTSTGLTTAEPSADALAIPQLPESFWDRPDLAQIRQGAWHYLAAPDAVLLHVMTRYAATIHPRWQLPRGGTLDVYGVVVAPSGGAKGLATKAGRSLFYGAPPSHPTIRMDRTISSGEGLIEGFMGPQEKDPDTKAPAERKVIRDATHFIIDEGTTLIAQLGRDGSTVIGVLCSAWVGEALGQQLADGAKTRWIPPHRVRVCATLNIQDSLAGDLYSDKLRATGFTGRCTFVSGRDPNIPDHDVADPGPLDLPNWSSPPTYSGILGYPDYVHAAVRDEVVGSHKGTLERDERQSHRILQRIKWSMILGMMAGRTEFDDGDWERGGQIVDISAAMLARLDAQHAVRDNLDSVTRLQTRANAEIYMDDAKVGHVVRRLERWVLSHIPSAGIGEKALRRKADSPVRMAYDDAVTNLVGEGKVLRSEDGTLTLP